jgi:hypothetical protein
MTARKGFSGTASSFAACAAEVNKVPNATNDAAQQNFTFETIPIQPPMTMDVRKPECGSLPLT